MAQLDIPCLICGKYGKSIFHSNLSLSSFGLSDMDTVNSLDGGLCRSCCQLIKLLDYHGKMIIWLKEVISTCIGETTGKDVGAGMQCSLCRETVSGSADLSEHTLEHASSSGFICPSGGCGRTFSSWSEMSSHVDLPRSCQQPDSPEPSSVLQHAAEVQHQATTCLSVEQSASLSQLQTEQDGTMSASVDGPVDDSACADPGSSVGVRCTHCDALMDSDELLWQHVRAAHGKFHCGLCCKSFGRRQDWSRHVTALHTPSSRLSCPQCAKQFSTRAYWQKHMERHRRETGSSSQLYRCRNAARADVSAHPALVPPAVQYCSNSEDDILKCVPDTSSLEPDVVASGTSSAGINQIDSGPDAQSRQDSVVADMAGRFTSSSASELRLHLRAKHSRKLERGSFQCGTCGKCFGWKNNLDVHMRIHRDERPYQCDLCGHTTRCSANLRLHKQRVHCDARPHICPVCQRTFKEKNGLAIHQRSHSGERPYVCDRCGVGFTTKGKLNDHISTHSEQRGFVCPYCSKSMKTSSILSRHCSRVHQIKREQSVTTTTQSSSSTNHPIFRSAAVHHHPADTSAVHHPTDTAAVHHPTDTVAAHHPTDTAAVHHLTDAAAVHHPADTAAVHHPTDITAVHQPTDTAAVHHPTDTAAVHHPTDTTAVHQPTGTTAVHQPTGTTAVHHHPADTAAVHHPADTAVHNPTGAAAVHHHSADTAAAPNPADTPLSSS